MATRRFAHFEYQITENNPSIGSIVEVSFDFKGYNIIRYVIIEDGNNLTKPEVIQLAKQRIDSEIKEGVLEHYSDNFIKSKLKVNNEVIDKSLKPRKNKKKLVNGLVIATLAVAAVGVTTALVFSLDKQPLSDLSFVGKHCFVSYNGEEVSKFNDKFEYGKKIELDLRAENSYELPSEITVQGVKADEYSYDNYTGKIIVTLNGNVSVVAEATQDCTVFIDANGGGLRLKDGTSSNIQQSYSYKVKPDTNLGQSLNLEIEKKFDIILPDWAKKFSEFKIYDDNTHDWISVSGDYKVYSNVNIRLDYEVKYLSVTIDPGEHYNSTSNEKTYEVKAGTAFGDFKKEHQQDFNDYEDDTKYKDSYRFYHWQREVLAPGNEKTFVDINDSDKILGLNGESLYIVARCSVNITFDGGEEGFGTPRHKEGWFPERDTWDEYKDEYKTEVNEGISKDWTGYKDEQGNKINDDYKISGPHTFTAQYKSSGDFAKDSWSDFKDNIIDFFENGEERENNPYYDEYKSKEGGKKENTFVGLTRTVEANGKIYNVTVVDENDLDDQNTTEVESHNNYLAFQFDEIIDLSDVMFDESAKFNEETLEFDNPAKYGERTLDNFVNKDLPKYFDQEFVNNVNEAKNIICADSNHNEDIDRIFYIPSATELGFTYGQTYGGEFSNEGSAFKYYNGVEASKRVKKKGTEESHAYWTRSIDVSSPVYAWAVGTDGNLGEIDGDLYYSQDAHDVKGIVPIFEIGGSNN